MDQPNNLVRVYSCAFGLEDKHKFRQRQNRDMFKDDSMEDFIFRDDQPVDSKQLMSEICNINLQDVAFSTYQKNGDDIISDYEIMLLIDTYFFQKVENSFKDSKDDITYKDNNNIDELTKQYFEEIEDLKELTLPFKRSINSIKTVDNSNNGSIIPSLRFKSFILPIKLKNHWTLIWVKFNKLLKYVELYQLSPLPSFDDKLSYRSQNVLKILILNILDISDKKDIEDFMFSYRFLGQSSYIKGLDLITVRNIQRIIKGYQESGFNIIPNNLPSLLLNETQNQRPTRTRALPLMNLEDIRLLNDRLSRKKAKLLQTSNTSSKGESRKRSADSRIRSEFINNDNTKNHNNNGSNKNGNNSQFNKITIHFKNNTTGNSNSHSLPTKKIKLNDTMKIKSLSKQRSKSTSTEPPSSAKGDSKLPIVTLENLETIKQSINYDKNKMLQIVEEYTKVYNEVEALLLDKWSRVELFSKTSNVSKDPPFLIYGPSQIELEILRENGIIATNTLKDKIKKYNVTLNTRTMRYLTSSRRWINQRFKYNKKLNIVYYTRDPNMIIPDYTDVPYIVMATHLAYGCSPSNVTFDIIHQNWYISRKMVSFIIGLCDKC
ncbi:hypothetical protein DAPK24_014950 [Pichia kluyveri]|uniref:Ubiquitin-like protease family profile domain-containing protein n=1 Tax=Pichia kluyveri TaxID=36015 RepID=A0AAV5R0F9_PICKL|nr:hypothetical protein DAPK24_014950 [Pichia kluyveri]